MNISQTFYQEELKRLEETFESKELELRTSKLKGDRDGCLRVSDILGV